jgi:hypothetical protein
MGAERVKRTTALHARIAGAVVLIASAAALLIHADSAAKSIAGNPKKPQPLNTTADDYFQRGTQPHGQGSGPLAPVISVSQCAVCHGNYDFEIEPYTAWSASVMGQSARDPLFHAALAIANSTANDAGAYCIRCHVPTAFIEGRADPPDGSAFIASDYEGVNCTFCHRLVDPQHKPGISPYQDEPILAALTGADLLPLEPGNAQYVLDPVDSRRGPRDDIIYNLHPGNPQPPIIPSPFHTTAEFCWTCHDVSNPLFERKPGNVYELAAIGSPHPNGDPRDMFPLHRTYSEWKNSYYSTVGIDHEGRFGGNHPTGIMRNCQDCHMPMVVGYGCSSPLIERPDLAHHTFLGSNTWVLRAVRDLYPDAETGLSEASVDAAIDRNIDFLQRASDLVLSNLGRAVRARIINRTGHKLPTGFPDGRRMWVNARFLDGGGNVIAEYGAYDFDTAELDPTGTSVYEMVLGLTTEHADAIDHPPGPTHHFVLANTVLKDNRIPPAGWFASVAAQNQTLPVGAVYTSGQHWHDTKFDIPPGAREAIVTVYYQVTTREFIEFLRDHDPSGMGDVVYALWVKHGMSQPVVMDMQTLEIPANPDLNGDGVVDVFDLLLLLGAWGPCPDTGGCPADLNDDGAVDVFDLLTLLGSWGS